MGERSRDWGGQVIISEIVFLLASMLFWHNLEECFGSLSYWKVNFFLIMRKPDSIACLCKKSDDIVLFLWSPWHERNLPPSLPKTPSPPCFNVGTSYSPFNLYSHTLLLLVKSSHEDSSVFNTFCHSFNVQLCLLSTSLFYLFPLL